MNDHQKYKILIIEDDTLLQKVYTEKLTREGYEVDLARDGEEGMYKALNTDPDLIILDIVLPKINGFHILANLRKNHRTQNIPVIILTNRGQEEEIERGMALGAQDYLVKVFASPMNVVEKIQKHLAKEKVVNDTVTGLARYWIGLNISKYDAPHLANDFVINDQYVCSTCKTSLLLELMHDYNFPGPGNRFHARIICPKCGKNY